MGNFLTAFWCRFQRIDLFGRDNLVLLRFKYDLISRISKKSTRNLIILRRYYLTELVNFAQIYNTQ